MAKKKKKYTRRRRLMELRIKFFLLLLLIAGIAAAYLFREEWIGVLHRNDILHVEENTEESVVTGLESEEAEVTEAPQLTATPEPTATPKPAEIQKVFPEEEIYTFLQGPWSWDNKIPWSGIWGRAEVEGGWFGEFGCGLCDLAGVYCTLSPYECSPLDMYEFAQTVSEYSPLDGYGAIDWPHMKDTLAAAGISSKICNMDPTYEEFCSAVESAAGVIALVSSYEDDTYWEETEGHYVNLWNYDSEAGDVFLGDSGDPNHNRNRIPLQYVYSALKYWGEHQYLLIYSYDEEKNTWKHDGITDEWNSPKAQGENGQEHVSETAMADENAPEESDQE